MRKDGLIESKIAIKFQKLLFLVLLCMSISTKNHEKWMNNLLVFMEASTDANGDLLNCKVNKKRKRVQNFRD